MNIFFDFFQTMIVGVKMVTFISFILIMLGAANWLSIGLMQYDFVAGIFGTQSSMLSRLIYIVIGFGGIWFLIMTLKQKGHVKINNNGWERMSDPLAKSKKRTESQQPPIQSDFSHQEQSRQQTNYEDYPQQQNYPYNTELGSEIHEKNSYRRRNPFE